MSRNARVGENGEYSYEVAKESEDFHENLSYKSNKM